MSAAFQAGYSEGIKSMRTGVWAPCPYLANSANADEWRAGRAQARKDREQARADREAAKYADMPAASIPFNYKAG